MPAAVADVVAVSAAVSDAVGVAVVATMVCRRNVI